MIRSDQILKTVEMIQKENLDVRAVTMGISLLDCRTGDAETTARKIGDKIKRFAGNFVETCDRIGGKYGVPVVNKRISVTPMAHIGAGFSRDGFVLLAKALDDAAAEVGIDIIGGYSANVEKGIGQGDANLIAAVPEALASTSKVCSSINAASTRHGLNMDAVALLGQTVRIVWLGQETVFLVTYGLGNAFHSRGNERNAGGHGFEHDHREPLAEQAGQHE